MATDEQIELHTGSYWRALPSIVKAADGIQPGWVLLLESIKKVDDQPHTIVLRGHPSEFDLVDGWRESESALWLRDKLTEIEFQQLYHSWKSFRQRWQDKSRHVVNPHVAIPIGLLYCKDKYHGYGHDLNLIAIGDNDAAEWLYQLAPTEAQKQELVKEYVGIYQHKETNRQRLLDSERKFHLCTISPDTYSESPSFGMVKTIGYIGYESSFKSMKEFSSAVKSAINKFTKDESKTKVYLAPTLREEKE